MCKTDTSIYKIVCMQSFDFLPYFLIYLQDVVVYIYNVTSLWSHYPVLSNLAGSQDIFFFKLNLNNFFTIFNRKIDFNLHKCTF